MKKYYFVQYRLNPIHPDDARRIAKIERWKAQGIHMEKQREALDKVDNPNLTEMLKLKLEHIEYLLLQGRIVTPLARSSEETGSATLQELEDMGI